MTDKKQNIPNSSITDVIPTNVIRDLTAGFLSGILSAAIFQPADKALYLSIKHHRPYFSPENWVKPFHAMSQTLLYRALSHALYFPTEQWTRTYFNKSEYACTHSSLQINVWGGITAGAITAGCLNPISVVRMYCWVTHGSFTAEVHNLWIGRGPRNFIRGMSATLFRDVIFGGVFSSFRHWNAFGIIGEDKLIYQHSYAKQFVWNGFAALMATTISSPFNYFRSIQFSVHHNEKPPSIWLMGKKILMDYKKVNGIVNKFNFFQSRFKFGWATIRLALGMAIGSQSYEFFIRRLPSQ